MGRIYREVTVTTQCCRYFARHGEGGVCTCVCVCVWLFCVRMISRGRYHPVQVKQSDYRKKTYDYGLLRLYFFVWSKETIYLGEKRRGQAYHNVAFLVFGLEVFLVAEYWRATFPKRHKTFPLSHSDIQHGYSAQGHSGQGHTRTSTS